MPKLNMLQIAEIAHILECQKIRDDHQNATDTGALQARHWGVPMVLQAIALNAGFAMAVAVTVAL